MRFNSPKCNITHFRNLTASLLQENTFRNSVGDVVILALDGLPAEIAQQLWPTALITELDSVFPTTSATGWLSSLTGLSVADHGVPGVVFATGPASRDLVNVFHSDDINIQVQGTLFSDALGLGYEVTAIVGDLAPYPCEWRNVLLRHAQADFNTHFFTTPTGQLSSIETGPSAGGAVYRRIVDAVKMKRAARRGRQPQLIWLFVDMDRYVHLYGYDGLITGFLKHIEDLATDLVGDRATLIVHSDHGLTPTQHDEELADWLGGLGERYACRLGGAGRARWIYADNAGTQLLRRELQCNAPGAFGVYDANDVFGKGSIARQRSGDLVLVATTPFFITEPRNIYDHGSMEAAEMVVPFVVWKP